MDHRFEELSKRIDDLGNDMNHRFQEFSKRIDDLRDDFNRRLNLLTWEVRIWFIVLAFLVTLLTFLKR